MNLVRLAFGAGLVGLGGIAVFMGLAVLLSSLSSEKAQYSVVRDGKTVTTSIDKVTDPDGYWRMLRWTGGLPALLGLIAIVGGRRILKG
jgi:hypothetical protein